MNAKLGTEARSTQTLTRAIVAYLLVLMVTGAATLVSATGAFDGLDGERGGAFGAVLRGIERIPGIQSAIAATRNDGGSSIEVYREEIGLAVLYFARLCGYLAVLLYAATRIWRTRLSNSAIGSPRVHSDNDVGSAGVNKPNLVLLSALGIVVVAAVELACGAIVYYGVGLHAHYRSRFMPAWLCSLLMLLLAIQVAVSRTTRASAGSRS